MMISLDLHGLVSWLVFLMHFPDLRKVNPRLEFRDSRLLGTTQFFLALFLVSHFLFKNIFGTFLRKTNTYMIHVCKWFCLRETIQYCGFGLEHCFCQLAQDNQNSAPCKTCLLDVFVKKPLGFAVWNLWTLKLKSETETHYIWLFLNSNFSTLQEPVQPPEYPVVHPAYLVIVFAMPGAQLAVLALEYLAMLVSTNGAALAAVFQVGRFSRISTLRGHVLAAGFTQYYFKSMVFQSQAFVIKLWLAARFSQHGGETEIWRK